MTTEPETSPAVDCALQARGVAVHYNGFRAVKDISLDVPRHQITALIGPSGSGKSTLLRCFNRMNDLVTGSSVTGTITFNGSDIYSHSVDPTEVRSRIGMVFQKPNPFPKSIFANVAFGLKINGFQGDLQEGVERSLKAAALWEDVKDRLHDGAQKLSGGQQQRLCIARALAVEPEVILMDEPASALDPISTLKIEELMRDLSANYTIMIVTHNMQQAARVSDQTAFMTMDDDRAGYLVEIGPTNEIFTNPRNQKTEDYITGRFG
jgi:phosphate transport system ATP-binding protein